MSYFYGKINRGHAVICLLHGSGLYLGKSIMGGSTVELFDVHI